MDGVRLLEKVPAGTNVAWITLQVGLGVTPIALNSELAQAVTDLVVCPPQSKMPNVHLILPSIDNGLIASSAFTSGLLHLN